MIGTIIGDVIGSFYEGKIKKAKSKNFELFTPYSICTDDTIMTIAVGQALVNTYQEKEILIIHYANLSFLLLDVLSKRFQFSELATQFPLTKQYELSYIIGGIYNNLIFWMNRDMKETPDELTEISLQFRNEESLSLLSLR